MKGGSKRMKESEKLRRRKACCHTGQDTLVSPVCVTSNERISLNSLFLKVYFFSLYPGDFGMTVPQGGGGQAEAKVNPDVLLKKEEREQHRGGAAPAGPLGPLSPSSTPSHRVPWQAGSWSQQGAKPQDRPEVDEDEEEEEEEVDFGRFADGAFGGDTYDEIEDGTGQVSQRPLLPASPDDSEFNLGGPEMDWPSSNMGQPGASNPTSNHHLSSSSAMFPPSLSPPSPHAGTPYRGKVHFCHCGKAYTLKSMRDRHVKMQHLNLRPFGCLVCAKTFKIKHHLTKHLKTHRSEAHTSELQSR